MMGVGPMELIVVLAIALIILGPKKLPEAGRSLGKGIREFKGSIGGDDADVVEPHPQIVAAQAEAEGPAAKKPRVAATVADEAA